MEGRELLFYLNSLGWGLVFVFGLLFFNSGQAFGEDSSSVMPEVRLPPEIPLLPRPGIGDSPLVVDGSNVNLFHDILISPLASWLHDNKFTLKVYRHLESSMDYGVKWVRRSEKNSVGMKLDDQGNLEWSGGGQPEVGFPFGSFQQLSRETNPINKAYKVLWNSAYTLSTVGDLAYVFELNWLNNGRRIRRSSGTLYRKYYFKAPLITEPAIKGDKKSQPEAHSAKSTSRSAFSGRRDVFFREVVQFNAPAVASGLAYLTTHFRSDKEDLLWVYSPVIERSRKLLETNKEDYILGGPLSLDDFFMWSGKIQKMDARVVKEKVLLLPFASLSMRKMDMGLSDEIAPSVSEDSSKSTQEGSGHQAEQFLTLKGQYSRGDGSNSSMLWNYETTLFRNNAAWVPTEIYFVPRNVWIIEMTSRDPFSLLGKQVLVIDKESMLPFYRIVYSRSGEYKKTLVAGWSMAQSTAKNKRILPILDCMFVVSSDSSDVLAFSFSKVMAFENKKLSTSKAFKAKLNIEAHGAKSAE